jgi:hypothetical protein
LKEILTSAHRQVTSRFGPLTVVALHDFARIWNAGPFSGKHLISGLALARIIGVEPKRVA